MAELLDSGERREFEGGAVRDIAEGKGRCDLLPLAIVSHVIFDDNRAVLHNIDLFMNTKNPRYICEAIRTFCTFRSWDVVTGILESSIQYEDGARKYSDRNWERGIPLHCFIDSGVRHYLKWLRGDQDEPHDRAFIWNMLGLLWTYYNRPDLDDIYMTKPVSD